MIPKSILSHDYAENRIEEEGIIKENKDAYNKALVFAAFFLLVGLDYLLVPLQNCSRKLSPSDMGVCKFVVPLSLMNMKYQMSQKSSMLMNKPLFITNQPCEPMVEINSP